jgi:hypothetical protein
MLVSSKWFLTVSVRRYQSQARCGRVLALTTSEQPSPRTFSALRLQEYTQSNPQPRLGSASKLSLRCERRWSARHPSAQDIGRSQQSVGPLHVAATQRGMESLQRLLFGAGAGDSGKDSRLEGIDVPTIDVYDQNAVKRTLDDAIADVSSPRPPLRGRLMRACRSFAKSVHSPRTSGWATSTSASW